MLCIPLCLLFTPLPWRFNPIPGLPLWGSAITLTGRTKLGMTPPDEWSARRPDLYLPTHNTQKRQTSTPPQGFEPAIPARQRPQTHALDRLATGIGAPTKLPTRHGWFLCIPGMALTTNPPSYHCSLKFPPDSYTASFDLLSVPSPSTAWT